jgi:hypothetical protein
VAQRYPGYAFEIWGDPRGGDRRDNTEVTAFEIFHAEGMQVFPASTDNNPEIRRSTVERVLQRRYGLLIAPSCLTLKGGMAGGYHYKAIKGVDGMFTERPVKNIYSHVVEAMENALMGGGEAMSVTRPNVVQLRPSAVVRRHPHLR